mgnify:CR=1 FL=1
MDLPTIAQETEAKDYFTKADGIEYAGKHLLLDIWGASELDNQVLLKKVLEEAVEAAGATLLHIHIHQFTPFGGLSGTAILAESHINVHTWPERNFAAFDVFMCGKAQPEKVEQVIADAFHPERIEVELHLRGKI